MKRLSPSTALVCGAISKSGVVVARGMYLDREINVGHNKYIFRP
jgi:hypothetical protein